MFCENKIDKLISNSKIVICSQYILIADKFKTDEFLSAQYNI